jgi:hypothetical protein
MHVAVGGPAVAVGVGETEGDAGPAGDAFADGEGSGVGAGDPWLADPPERHAPAARSTVTMRSRTTFTRRL